MTAQNRTTLKALFQTGDTLLQSSFDTLIDSFLDIAETSSQTIAGAIIFSSAVTFNDIVSAQSGIYTSTITPTGGGTVTLNGGLTATGNINIGTTDSSVAALGTTRASAYPISATYTVLKTVSAGTNEGIRAGGSNIIQYIFNATSATAKVYSYDNVQAGSNIDGTSVVSLLPNQRMIIYTLNPIPGTLSAVGQYTIVGAKASV